MNTTPKQAEIIETIRARLRQLQTIRVDGLGSAALDKEEGALRHVLRALDSRRGSQRYRDALQGIREGYAE